MKRTALYDSHLDLGAKMTEFAGFEMPVLYSNLKQEAMAVRKSAGMFDVSHMGEFFIRGKDAEAFIDRLIPNDFAGAAVGKAVYSPLCREDGSIVDDLICYKLDNETAMMCVNAANISKDWEWIQKAKEKFAQDLDVSVTDRSEDYSLVAVQGPKAFEILRKIDSQIRDIQPFSIQIREEGETPVIYARTGYTGEDGFEIFAPSQSIMGLWSKLLHEDVAPCGLGARDVLRLEACFPLYGQELDDKTTPLETGLRWTVKFGKKDFIGKAALEESRPRYASIKLILEKGVPRAGYEVLDGEGNVIGKVTSGSMSVVLGKGVAMARVEKEKYNPKAELFINIRNKRYPATRHKGAFVKGGHK